MSETSAIRRPSRRELVQATAAAAVAAPLVLPATALGRSRVVAASERIGLGIIGVNGMGQANLGACAGQPDVEVLAVCDVDTSRREAVLARHRGAKGYRDYRELLARRDIDAVIIATPPHWHCRMAVDAAEAGKDIFLQKPMTLYPDETLAVRNAVNRHRRVSQIGTQIHATENYRRVVEYVRSGKLGKVSVVRTFNVMNQGPDGIGVAPREDPPAGLDWDLWLGPGPARQFNRLLFRDSYYHSSFWAYSGGWTPGMAPHIVDLPVWALDLGVPEVAYCTGGRYAIRGDGDAPDAQEATWRYPGLTMTWTMSCCNSFAFDFGRGVPARRLGIYFHGLNGTLMADYGRFEVVPEGEMLKDATPPPPTIPPSPGHEREWLDCVRSRRQPSCSVNYHYRIDLALTLANLSMTLGRALRWDSAAERIAGDAEAVRRARPVYRAPWRFPAEHLRRPFPEVPA
ncbi:MAG TPA: Gfo/Idh/MocA family oxidoreductase [Chthonomonadales bacterium]|nr:Gfo/Idh/MocA family oxidoreductase [Chthonomonadales bacterium]